jgi:hypothetical protein
MTIPDEARTQAAARAELQLAIGIYITQFAALESIVTATVARILNIEPAIAFFMLKEIPIDPKIKLLRRAASEKCGEDESAAYRTVLNRVAKAAEFRNTLVHGAFVAEGEYGATFLQGRLGSKLTTPVAGLDVLGPDTIRREAQSLDSMSDELIKLWPKSSSPSNSKSREQSGSGDQ